MFSEKNELQKENLHLVVSARRPIIWKNDCFHLGKPQCTNCKKFGHVEKDCWFKNKNQQANYTEDKEEHLFFACQAVVEQESKELLLDSGCSNHMTLDEGMF